MRICNVMYKKLYLGPQMRALNKLKSARCLELSPMKSGAASALLPAFPHPYGGRNPS
jgi:hypothetical protein